ncbi:M20/M25/M40 family metallo-hydrolase [Pacificimonas sp. ICDLI1SI03]
MTPLRLASATALCLVASPLPAQESLRGNDVGGAVLSSLDAGEAEAEGELIAIGSIISPSGEEHERAAKVAELMREAGLADVEITEAPNAVGRIAGRSPGQALVFVSTLDDLATVAEHQRDAGTPLERQRDRIVGPGSNTSLTTAAMLAAAEALVSVGFQPEHDIIFAAVAQEETGLNGMRALYEEYRDDAAAFIDILGDGSDISYGALGIHWWRVEAGGPSGHTLRGGLPNVNRGIAEAVSRIFALPAAADELDMTRLNIAVIESGKVFNHKPAEGWFSLDIRSLDAGRIAAIEADVDAIMADVSRDTGIELKRKAVNLVPGGQIAGARESSLVRWASAIARGEGRSAELTNAGSANLNIAIGGGTPAIGLGGERGGMRGQSDEWASIPVLHRTARLVALLAVALGEALPPPD